MTDSPMPSKTSPADVVISAAEFSWLLTYHRITPPPGTVFEEAARVDADSSAQARLEESGYLSDQLGSALSEAAESDPQVTLHDAAVDAVGTGFYFDRADESQPPAGLLVWQRPPGDYRLVFPLDAAQTLQTVSEVLDPVGSAPPPAFEGVFTREALTALAAALDYVRTLFAASLVQRQGLSGVFLRRSDMQTQVSSGHAHRDYRSLVALLNALASSPISAEPDALDKGIEELVGVGLLLEAEANADGWLPAPGLVGMASNLLIPLPALSLAAEGSGDGQNGATPHQLIALRGNSLWLLRVPAESEGTASGVQIAGVDGLTLMIEIQEFLKAARSSARARAEALTEPEPADRAINTGATKKFCTACGLRLKPGVKFCTGCGTPA